MSIQGLLQDIQNGKHLPLAGANGSFLCVVQILDWIVRILGWWWLKIYGSIGLLMCKPNSNARISMPATKAFDGVDKQPVTSLRPVTGYYPPGALLAHFRTWSAPKHPHQVHFWPVFVPGLVTWQMNEHFPCIPGLPVWCEWTSCEPGSWPDCHASSLEQGGALQHRPFWIQSRGRW